MLWERQTYTRKKNKNRKRKTNKRSQIGVTNSNFKLNILGDHNSPKHFTGGTNGDFLWPSWSLQNLSL